MISYMLYSQPAGFVCIIHQPTHQCLVYARLARIYTYRTILDNARLRLGCSKRCLFSQGRQGGNREGELTRAEMEKKGTVDLFYHGTRMWCGVSSVAWDTQGEQDSAVENIPSGTKNDPIPKTHPTEGATFCVGACSACTLYVDVNMMYRNPFFLCPKPYPVLEYIPRKAGSVSEWFQIRDESSNQRLTLNHKARDRD